VSDPNEQGAPVTPLTPVAPMPAGGDVQLVGPDGQPATAPQESVHLALSQGYRVASPDETQSLQLQATHGDAAGGAAAFGLGALRGLTFGASDAMLNESGALSGDELKKYAEANPLLSGAGHVAGVLAPALLSDGASLEGEIGAEGTALAGEAAQGSGLTSAMRALTAPGRMVSGLGDAASQAASEAVGGGLLGQLAGGAARGAVEMPAYGVGDLLTEDVFDNKPFTAEAALSEAGKDALLGGLTGGAIEGGIGLGKKYVPAALSKASEAMQRLAEKLEPEKLDSSGKIREFAERIGKGRDQVETALEDFHRTAKPAMVEKLVGQAPASQAVMREFAAIRDTIDESEFGSAALGKSKQLFEKAEDTAANAGSLAEQQIAFDKLKRGLDAVRPPVTSTASEMQTFGKLVEARSKLKGLLEDDVLFGPAGTYQKEVNAALSPYYAAREAIEKGGKTKLFSKATTSLDDQGNVVADRHLVADAGTASGFVGQLARNSPLSDLRKQALENYTSAAKDALEQIGQNTYEKLGRKNVDLAEVGKHLGSIGEARDAAVAEKTKELTSKTGRVHGDPVLGWTHVVGIPGVLADGLQIARGAKSEAIATLARTAAKQTEKISLGLDAALSGGGKRAVNLGVPATVALSDVGRSAGSEARHEAYQRRVAEVEQLRTNPEHQTAQLAASTSALQPHAPDTAAHMQQRLLAREQKLAQTMPKSPTPPDPLGQKPQPYHPAPAELARWERVHRAVLHPLSLVDDLRTSRVTPESVDAVRETSPAMYGEMVRQLQGKLAQHKEPIPYTQRLQISLFLGQPVSAAQNMIPPQLSPRQATGGDQMPLRNASAMTQLSGANRSATKYGGETD
jgi:hypothetical protein